MVNLSVNIAGIKLKNPVLTASGTFGYGLEFAPYLDLNILGGIVVKGLSLNPKDGNPMPRIYETSGGMLNAIGLQNIGIEAFVREKVPALKEYNTAVIANFFGHSVQEYCDAARALSASDGIAGLEMNISCPNIKSGGISFGSDANTAFDLVREVKKITSLPLIVKLSPNVTDIASIAKAVEDAGADAVSLINTLIGMSIDIASKKPRLANITGGLSGPAIKPVALRMVWQAAKAVKIPVIGIGGICSYEDALEFMIAGASAVQIGTANFVDPCISVKIIEGIKKYCKDHNINNIKDIVGSIALN